MTSSEFAFLALGLVLGVASGAALVEVLRSRPPSRREICVTVAPNSIPRRATTLADAEPADRGPARGGPADRRWVDRDMTDPEDAELAATADVADPPPAEVSRFQSGSDQGRDRTPVPSGSKPPPLWLAGAGGAMALAPPRPAIGIAIAREPDPMIAALRATAAATAAAAMRKTHGRSAGSREAAGASAGASAGVAVAAAASEGDGGPPAESPGDPAIASGAPEAATPAYAPDDLCADQRRVADERCAVAARAREGATAALETLRSSQRSYDDLVSRAEAEAAAADPRTVRTAKEAAQQAFRNARAAGRSHDDIEAAARDWLTEINRINVETRDAAAAAEKHRRAAAEIGQTLERISVEADAARISAEVAEEACVAAREAVAACQEAAALAAAGAPATELPPIPAIGTAIADDDAIGTPMGSRAGEDAAIVRLLRGDREVLTRIVAKLGGDDEAARRRWQGLIGGLLVRIGMLLVSSM